jgi:hypothetical protein
MAYQRTFVEAGYKDDDQRWAYEFGVEVFQIYEWTQMQSAIKQESVLRERICGEIRTALNAFVTDKAQSIGNAFLNAANRRMRKGTLLYGEPDEFFALVYGEIETFLTTDSLSYRAVTPLHNVRSPIVRLDSNNSIGPMQGNPREDSSWNGVTWDDSFEVPARFEHNFQLPILRQGEQSDIQSVIDACRTAVERVLITIAVAQRSTATAGPTLIENAGFCPEGAGCLRLLGDSPRQDLRKTLIASAHAQVMVSTWAILQDPRQNRVRLAGERLATIELARDDESALLEGVTALESILGDDSRNELAHRLSLLAARLIARDLGKPEREVYDGLLKAFQRRTTVLRGKEGREDVNETKTVLRLVDDVVRRLTQLRAVGDSRFVNDPVDIFLTPP